MKMTFRWYGFNDPITLSQIRQIPNMTGVVTAIYDVPVGELWPVNKVESIQKEIKKYNLTLEVIESLPVHENIKLGASDRDHYIDIYCENIRTLSKFGIKCICYNFMPVFDWLRTTLNYKNNDGSTSLAFLYPDYIELDKNNLHLPGWDESYTQEQLRGLLESYSCITHDTLFNNLIYFLDRVIPVCKECDINMAIHPDDPPLDIFQLPRIMSTMDDFKRLFAAIPDLHNGMTLCTGSLTGGRHNDIYKITEAFSHEGRIHFAHLRNIKFLGNDGSFAECAHLSSSGDIDMYKLVKILVKNEFKGYIRPDHGRMIWNESGNPGYGLYDRALGASYLNGLFEAAEKELY